MPRTPQVAGEQLVKDRLLLFVVVLATHYTILVTVVSAGRSPPTLVALSFFRPDSQIEEWRNPCAFVVGLFLAFITEQIDINPLLRLFFVTGFLGGYTTFSSYAWEALQLAQNGASANALL